MIQPLRSAHRHAFIALAVLLPAVIVLGLYSRPPQASRGSGWTEIPDSARPCTPSPPIWRTHSIQTEFYCAPAGADGIYVVLTPAEALQEPDLLLYWSASEPSGERLPPDARLAGPLITGRAISLPQTPSQKGYLLLFSLPNGRVMDVAPVEKVP